MTQAITTQMEYNASATIFVGEDYQHTDVYGGQFFTDRFDGDHICGSAQEAAERLFSEIQGACASERRYSEYELAPDESEEAITYGACASAIFGGS